MTNAISKTVIAFRGTEEINRAIDAIRVRGKELDEAIQLTGLSIIHHIDQCGDVTVVKALYEAMPKGSRRNALVEWLVLHGKVQVNTDKKSNKDLPFLYNKFGKTDLVGATNSPWYSFKPEKALDQEFNLAAALATIKKQVLQAQTKGKVIVGMELLGDLEALAAKAAPIAEQSKRAAAH
ncbi:hypothetical protein [Pseudomonas phage PAXYB1]|uniref:Uncharacterized protein n=18 Tax=root TaxID=1 RepID=H6WTU7_9CAUD|nr:hypothetical protein HOS06_gp03 [Pseudomonas phage PT5]YP_002117783.1 hypothetical protein PT2_gp04 [Pseudomonas phage PT2]YP_006299925.1 hypothetical protein TM32_0003 [Pseudomonas phage vB_Pae-TbilisiM32]YP_008431312.1 hypothetical protein MPK7_04 [Pseudomonas phage MPK7]YP_009792245.1 hypothetical protein HOS03_gp03 [Pseudomonas phage phiNFS]YP_009800389.1 hypothetical protein HOT06_gp05 [Pseudomonas phage PAXYB1]YP_009800450.1 hypothetical protein HOT07_gp06 [Pseudomonas phage vB_PaeP_